MNTATIVRSASVASAESFFRNLHRASDKTSEALVIELFMGEYYLGEPHGSQLDEARHVARVVRDPRFTELEIRSGRIMAELTASEKELLRRWRNYERRALIARNTLRDLDAEILELTEAGDIPSQEQCVRRAQLVSEVEFWQRRADNPQNFPLEVDQWGSEAEEAKEVEDLESLIAEQKRDQREWNRMAK